MTNFKQYREAWETLIAPYRDEHFVQEFSFGPPASGNQIARAEEARGVKFPDDLRELLSTFDGLAIEVEVPDEIIFDFQVWSTEEMIEVAPYGDAVVHPTFVSFFTNGEDRTGFLSGNGNAGSILYSASADEGYQLNATGLTVEAALQEVFEIYRTSLHPNCPGASRQDPWKPTQVNAAMQKAIEQDDAVEAVRLLADVAAADALLRSGDSDFEDWIFQAAKLGRTAIVKALLEGRGNRELKLDYALFAAYAGKHLETMEILLQSGASNQRVLIEAAFAAEMEILTILIGHNVDLDRPDSYGQTALIGAIQKGHTEVVQKLLEHGADPNRPHESGKTPLLFATEVGNIQILRMLLAGGANVQADSGLMRTAGGKGNPDVIRLLHQAGVSLDAADRAGMTGLMNAVLNDRPDAVRLLCELGADVTVKNKRGKTAGAYAQERKSPAIQELLDLLDPD